MKRQYFFIAICVVLVISSILIGRSIATFPDMSTMLILVSVLMLFLAFSHVDIILSFLVLAMLLSPEIVVGHIPGRDIVVRFEDFILVLLTVMWIARASLQKDKAFLVKTPLNSNIMIYAVLFVLFTGRGMIIAGVNPLKGFFYVLKYLEYFFIYFLTASIIQRRGQVKWHVFMLLFTFAIVNIYAFSKIGEGVRVSAPFEGGGQPNTLGGYQVLLLGVVFGLLLHVRSGLVRLACVGLIILTIPPFLFTLSRSSYMSIIPMYLTFFFVERSKRILLVGGILIAVIVGVFLMPHEVNERIKYTFEPIPQQYADPVSFMGVEFGPSASARVHSWKEVLREWKKSPFFGYGITGKGFLDGQYMKTLVELGAIGLLAFIFLLGAIQRHTLRIYHTTKDDFFKGLAVGFLAGHMGMVFHAITANTYIIIRIMEPYWFMAAIVMVLAHIEERDRHNEPEEKTFTSKIAVNGQEHCGALTSLGHRI